MVAWPPRFLISNSMKSCFSSPVGLWFACAVTWSCGCAFRKRNTCHRNAMVERAAPQIARKLLSLGSMYWVASLCGRIEIEQNGLYSTLVTRHQFPERRAVPHALACDREPPFDLVALLFDL